MAQQPPSDPGGADTRIVLDVTRVNMLFTVTDKKGRFVTDLDQRRFRGHREQEAAEIIEFTAESDLPLRLAILIDTSNSIRERFRFKQEAAIEFVNSVMRPEQDKAMVVSFDTGAELVADLTDDHREAGQCDPRAASGRRHGAVRRHLLRLPRQADAGSAALTSSAAPWSF